MRRIFWPLILETLCVVVWVTEGHQAPNTPLWMRRRVRNSDSPAGTDHHKAMEDQIRAVFSKVAYDFGHFNPAMQAPSSMTTQKTETTTASTSTTRKPYGKTHKIYINSPKVSPEEIIPDRKPSTHKQPVVTPFPNFEWFTKDAIPAIKFPPNVAPTTERSFVFDVATTPRPSTEDAIVDYFPKAQPSESVNVTHTPSRVEITDPIAATKHTKVAEPPTVRSNNQIPSSAHVDKADRTEEPPAVPHVDVPSFQDPHGRVEEQDQTKLGSTKVVPYVEPVPEWEKGIKEWGIAWQLHIYILGVLFLMLALYAGYSYRYLYTNNRIVPKSYFCAVNTFLFVLGTTRALSFFYDAYNIKKLLPPILAQLLFNISSPCLTSALAVLIMSLSRTLKLRLCPPLVQNSMTLTIIIILHLTVSVSCDIVVGSISDVRVLVLVCFVAYVGWLGLLTVTYLFTYRRLLAASIKLKSILIVEKYSKLQMAGQVLPRRVPPSSYVLAIKVTLGISLMGFALVVVLLYGLFGLFGVFSEVAPDPWQWWVYQFIVRMLEVLMTYLMAFVISLKMNSADHPTQNRSYRMSVLSLMRCKQSCAANTICGGTSGSSLQTDNIDESYPAMCNINQAVQKHEIYGSQSAYSAGFSTPKLDLVRKGWTRRSNTNTLISVKSDKSEPQRNNTLPSSRPSSMLCTEQGFVRFRSQDDPEQPMEHVLRQTTLPKSKRSAETAELPAEIIDKCFSLIPPHVYEELYYYNSARKRNPNYVPQEHPQNEEKLTSSRLFLEKIKSITKSSSEQTCSAPYYYPTSALRDSSDRMPGGLSHRGSSETCSVCRNESPCSSQSAAHSFDVRMYYRREPEQNVSCSQFPEGKRPYSRAEAESDCQHQPAHGEAGARRAESQCTLCLYDTSRILSPRGHPVDTAFRGDPGHSKLTRVKRVASDSDIVSSDNTSQDGSVDADDEHDSPSNDLHTGLDLKLTRSIDLADHYCIFEHNPNSTDITPDSAVVSDMRDSPHKRRNFPPHVQISSSIQDSSTQVTLPHYRPREADTDPKEDDYLGRNYAKNLLHKLKGSNFSLNSSNYAYSPLNSDDSDQSRFYPPELDDEHPFDTYPIDPRIVSRLETAGINKECDVNHSKLKPNVYTPRDTCVADTFTQTEFLGPRPGQEWSHDMPSTPRRTFQR